MNLTMTCTFGAKAKVRRIPRMPTSVPQYRLSELVTCFFHCIQPLCIVYTHSSVSEL